MSHIPAPTGLHATRSPSYLDLIKLREFLTYWISQFISCIGDRLDQVAVISLVIRSVAIEESQKGAVSTTIFLAATLPYIIVTPLAAGLVDRLERKKLMIATDIYRAAVVFLAIFYYSVNMPIWHYYVVVFLSGCGTAVFGPCKLSFIPQIVPSNNLVKANSMSSMTGTLGTLIGTMLGGQIIALVAGPRIPTEELVNASAATLAAYESSAVNAARALLITDVTTFLFSAWMLTRIRLPKGNLPFYMCQRIRECGGEEKLDPDSAGVLKRLRTRKKQPYFIDLIDSLRYAWTHKIGRRQLLLTAHLWFIVGIAFAGLNGLTIDVFGMGEKGFSITQGILGVSMFLGGLALGLSQQWFQPRKITTCLMLALVLVAPLPALVPTAHAWLINLVVIPVGIIAGATIIGIDSVYQLCVPNRLRGRVFALNYIVLNITMVSGMAIVSSLLGSDTQRFSREVFFYVSGLAVIGALMTWFGAVKLKMGTDAAKA